MQKQRLQDFGPYRIVRPIATGGMAEIYLARQRGIEGLERTVVIKRILERYAGDAEFVTMFLDEARLLAALSHPNIAQVFDLGKVDGSYYLVMEYVRGPVLGRLMAAAKERDGDGRLPRREALGIGLAIAEGLRYAHERRDEVDRPLNIVHRDLNPSNVLVSYDGGVKLIDFGIAKAATKVYETQTGVIKGTYGYIAPEQLVGTTRVDRRADVFALGILLYEMCVGVHPFDVSDEPNLVDRILEARYRRPRDVQPDIPRDLDRLIASCLAPHPEGRPDDMAELIDGLAKHLGEQGMVPTQTSLAEVTRRLVSDDEGPRPLKPLTSPERPRPFGKEPTRTQRLAFDQLEGAPAPEKTAVAKLLPTSQEWDESTVRFSDDEPLTLAGGPSAPGPDGTVEIPDDDDDEMPTIARALPLASTGSGDTGDEEVPTRLMPLSTLGDIQKIAPPENTYVPPPRKPRPRRWPTLALVVGALLALGAMGGVAFSVIRSMSDEPAPTPIETAQRVAEEPVTESPAGPIELRVVSEPDDATVHVDGRLVEGATPLTVTLPQDTQHVWLRLSKPGHLDQEREVSATVGEARFVLSPLAVGEQPSAGVAGDTDEAGGADEAEEVSEP